MPPVSNKKLYYVTASGDKVLVGTFGAQMPTGNVINMTSPDYLKLTFSETPTGDMLTWLKANAVKQAGDTAVQTEKALTITSNGTTEITPDAPYDAMSKVNVTVDVASGGGGGETTSLSVGCATGNMERSLFCLWQTSNGWIGTANFDSATNFTIPEVIVGGYVIFTREPEGQLYFMATEKTGVEDAVVDPMDTEWDHYNGALIIKIIAPSPQFTLHLNTY